MATSKFWDEINYVFTTIEMKCHGSIVNAALLLILIDFAVTCNYHPGNVFQPCFFPPKYETNLTCTLVANRRFNLAKSYSPDPSVDILFI